MQQMEYGENQREERESYGRYQGDSSYNEHRYSRMSDQKINDDSDEQYADMLARRIRLELSNETGLSKGSTHQLRLALAIVSVVMIVLLFVALVIALILGAASSIALGWGFVAACAAILFVNGYFNWASTVIERPARGKNITDDQRKK